jgi:hypothetical protein
MLCDYICPSAATKRSIEESLPDDMANPDPGPGPHPQTKPALSAEYQEKARAAAKRLGYGPDALQKRIQQMMADLAETRRKNEAHAAKMGVDPNAVAKRWALEIRSPFPDATQLPTWSFEEHEVSSPNFDTLIYDSGSAIEDVVTPGDSSMDILSPDALMSDVATTEEEATVDAQTAGAKQSVAATQPSPAKVMRRRQKEPRVNGELSSKKRNPLGIAKKVGSKSKSPAANAVTQPSRTAGDARETATDFTPSLFISQIEKYPVLDLHQWYLSIGSSSRPMTELAKRRPQELAALESLKNCIGRCEKQLEDRRKLIDDLRNYVHKAEFLPNITKFVIRAARILAPQNGLPRIFGEDVNFPPDLKADAYQLYLRWMRGEFSQDILRGINTVKGKDRTSDRLDQSYRARYPSTAKCYGENGLVLGQCWPTQLCTVRDGAHGSSQGGIFGEKEKGTYSIVLSGGHYHDKDNGDTIEYCGTDGKNFTPTEATQHMITSANLGNPIRVIRSHQLHEKNKVRPEQGLRYDELYTIKSYEVMDHEKQIHRFKLERCPGQEPIRCGNDASRRPTIYEVSEYRQVRA